MNTENTNFRMEVYITQHSFNYLQHPVNWHNCVPGVFQDEQTPTVSLVQALVNTQWTTRREIKIFKTGIYYIFECMHAMDKEAILHHHAAVFDGKLITFRRCDWFTVLSHLNFTTMRLWIRVSGLPLGFLDAHWAQNVLNHVGFIETIQDFPHILPPTPEFRALVWVDTSLPSIPGCFLHLFGDRVVWVYFQYEGVFRFCKSCGKIGHTIARCRTSLARAQSAIQNRITFLENEGFEVLRGPTDTSLYTNAIKGLRDRFNNQNSDLDLTTLPDNQGFDHRGPPSQGDNSGGGEDDDGYSGGFNGRRYYYSDSSTQRHSGDLNSPGDSSPQNLVYDPPPLTSTHPNFHQSPGYHLGFDNGPFIHGYPEVPPN
ncbi:hypothetical protein RDABS01_024467 [Bienertia sinuspersici]